MWFEVYIWYYQERLCEQYNNSHGIIFDCSIRIPSTTFLLSNRKRFCMDNRKLKGLIRVRALDDTSQQEIFMRARIKPMRSLCTFQKVHEVRMYCTWIMILYQLSSCIIMNACFYVWEIAK